SKYVFKFTNRTFFEPANIVWRGARAAPQFVYCRVGGQTCCSFSASCCRENWTSAAAASSIAAEALGFAAAAAVVSKPGGGANDTAADAAGAAASASSRFDRQIAHISCLFMSATRYISHRSIDSRRSALACWAYFFSSLSKTSRASHC
ncbi:hypothetical protein PFISCL1PPCAC_17789, partial [Pristionchus fissidentatus]